MRVVLGVGGEVLRVAERRNPQDDGIWMMAGVLRREFADANLKFGHCIG
jgi:hypothetical protein